MQSAIDFKQKVLVVDDFEAMRKIIRDLLRAIGFSHIYEADSGTEALSLLRSEKFGLILADWNMSAMTGLELLQIIRSEPASKDIPVVMVTAEAQKENVMEAIKAGADDFVVKHFSVDTIRAKIEQIYRKRK